MCVCDKAPSSSSCPLCADGDEKWMERSKSKCPESSCDMKDKKRQLLPMFFGDERDTHKWNRGEGGGEEEEDSGTLSNKQTFQQKQHEVQQRAKENKSYKRVRIE